MVVAYGTAKKSAFTGSAATIKDEKITSRQTSNVTNALAGQVAGVQTPVIDSVVCLARAVVDDIAEGRTAENLGIAGMSKEAFLKLCMG